MKNNLSVMLALLIASVVVAAGFTGCSSMGGTGASTQAQKIETTCTSVAAATRVLTVANKAGKLSVDQATTVHTALTVTNPICNAATIPTLTDIEFSAFVSAATLLQTRAASAK